MGEIDEAIKETLHESGDRGLNHYIAICVAVTATFMALVSIKSGKNCSTWRAPRRRPSTRGTFIRRRV
jgi:hypothetical protein